MSHVSIICHRGWWTKPEEQNTLAAFARAFDAGLGVELDVRDCNCELVVSHDPTSSEEYKVSFGMVLELLGDRDLPLAVNVKACGLAPMFVEYNCLPKRVFFFDHAVPDMADYFKHHLPVYERYSLRERVPESEGIWVDCGPRDWIPIQDPLKPMCFVSSELHANPNQYRGVLWATIRKMPLPTSLCTDKVEEALEFFK